MAFAVDARRLCPDARGSTTPYPSRHPASSRGRSLAMWARPRILGQSGPVPACEPRAPNRRSSASGSSPRRSDKDARISFAFSGNSTTFSSPRSSFGPAARWVWSPANLPAPATSALFQENESTPRILDRMVFLGETEKGYFDGMRSYIKKRSGLRRLGHGNHRLRAAGPVCPERHGLHRQPLLLAAPQLPRPAVGLGQLAHRAKAHDGPSGRSDALSRSRPSGWPASPSH